MYFDHRYSPTRVSLRSRTYGFCRLFCWSSVSAKAELDRNSTTCHIFSMVFSLISSDEVIANRYARPHLRMLQTIWRTTGGHGWMQSRRKGLPFFASCGIPSTLFYSASHYACQHSSCVPIFPAISHFGKQIPLKAGTSSAKNSLRTLSSYHV
jgi:hypothetical protein